MYTHPLVKAEKIMWVTANDEHVRSSHMSLNGQVTTPGQFFTRKDGTKSPLRHPGDMSAPANEVINCRCVIIEYFKNL
jgi:uncharacterized protein with gpF-like domain